MAIGDPYAVASEYRGRVNKSDTADDATILAQLTAVSHYIDMKCRRKDGFNIAAAAIARVYDISTRPTAGGAFMDPDDPLRLWLPHDIGSTTNLAVKVDQNADYDYLDSDETLAVNTDFWLGPANATAGADPWPYCYLDIHPNSTKISAWPIQRRAIEVTAQWGFPEVPEAIKEATILITRQWRDAQESGYSLTLEQIDMALPQGREIAIIAARTVAIYGKAPGV